MVQEQLPVAGAEGRRGRAPGGAAPAQLLLTRMSSLHAFPRASVGRPFDRSGPSVPLHSLTLAPKIFLPARASEADAAASRRRLCGSASLAPWVTRIQPRVGMSQRIWSYQSPSVHRRVPADGARGSSFICKGACGRWAFAALEPQGEGWHPAPFGMRLAFKPAKIIVLQAWLRLKDLLPKRANLERSGDAKPRVPKSSG